MELRLINDMFGINAITFALSGLVIDRGRVPRALPWAITLWPVGPHITRFDRIACTLAYLSIEYARLLSFLRNIASAPRSLTFTSNLHARTVELLSPTRSLSTQLTSLGPYFLSESKSLLVPSAAF